MSRAQNLDNFPVNLVQSFPLAPTARTTLLGIMNIDVSVQDTVFQQSTLPLIHSIPTLEEQSFQMYGTPYISQILTMLVR